MTATQLATCNPDGSGQVYLGRLGRVSGLKYSFVIPGGCDSLNCMLSLSRQRRYSAVEPGRVVRAFRGGSWIWEGILEEPQPIYGGWNISAFGSGQYGSNYMAGWNLSSAFLNDPLDWAINNRGLRWVNPGLNNYVFTPANKPDKYSQNLTEWLNELTLQSGLMWYVGRWNILRTFEIPLVTPAAGGVPSGAGGVPPVDFTPATRLIVLPRPPARTVTGHINRLHYKFNSGTYATGANKGQPIYSTVWVTNARSESKFGHFEGYLDMTNAGVLSSAAAAANANFVMNNFMATSWSGSFTISGRNYMTMGGTPVDPGCEQAGVVAKLMVADSGEGGEIIPGPARFIVGRLEYDDANKTAEVTPFNSYRHDLGTLLTYHVKALRT